MLSADADPERVVLGWREWVALPALGIAAIRAKVDSGARSCALHVDAQWRFVDGGAPWVGFRMRTGRLPDASAEVVEAAAAVLDEREVTDSGGHRSRRVFLRTTLALADARREIDINLADRRGMRFPMLLGRTAIAGAFTVDPARSFVHGRPGIRNGESATLSVPPVRALDDSRFPIPDPRLK